MVENYDKHKVPAEINDEYGPNFIALLNSKQVLVQTVAEKNASP